MLDHEILFYKDVIEHTFLSLKPNGDDVMKNNNLIVLVMSHNPLKEYIRVLFDKYPEIKFDELDIHYYQNKIKVNLLNGSSYRLIKIEDLEEEFQRGNRFDAITFVDVQKYDKEIEQNV